MELEQLGDCEGNGLQSSPAATLLGTAGSRASYGLAQSSHQYIKSYTHQDEWGSTWGIGGPSTVSFTRPVWLWWPGPSFKKKSRASGAIPPNPPLCPSSCSERLCEHRGERDTSLEGEVCEGLRAWAFMMQACESVAAKRIERKQKTGALFPAPCCGGNRTARCGVKRMFAELASALFWSDKIPTWTPSGRENGQVCLTFRVLIHKHTSPLPQGRWSGFYDRWGVFVKCQ